LCNIHGRADFDIGAQRVFECCVYGRSPYVGGSHQYTGRIQI
jgi:hypothetical protein